MSETQSCRRIAHDLTALAQGELSGPSRSAIELHLARCESCKREYDETCKLLALAGDLPRLSSTSRFHQKMMRAVQVEREVIRMPARERLGMAVGYVGYKLRLSRKARLLMYAMAAQVAVLITMVVGFGLIVQKTEIPQPQMEVEPLSDMENRDPGAGNGFQFPDKESLDPLSSSERFFDPPSRLFNDVVTDFTLPGSYKDSGTALPLDLLDRMVEQENRLELSRFRMEARFPWKGRDRISEVRGGDRRTARTVEQGLDGLQRVQAAAGSWDSDGLLGSDSRAVTGITALAVAAFLSDGHTQERGRYAQTVSKGLRFLMDA
ncbi:MAG: zf-HC2 domain-containing protein, partial [Planctomycetota bacterium]